MNLTLKKRRKTTADLILNGIGAPISSIEFDSTELTKEEVVEEISRRFCEMFTFKYHEKLVGK